jgi:hypothetical protein
VSRRRSRQFQRNVISGRSEFAEPVGGRHTAIGLRLPEEEGDAPPPTRVQMLKRKLGELWTSVAGI